MACKAAFNYRFFKKHFYEASKCFFVWRKTLAVTQLCAILFSKNDGGRREDGIQIGSFS